MPEKTAATASLSETLAAAFLKTFFTAKEAAEIKKLENAIWEVWKTDPGRILRRVGYNVRDNGDPEREQLWRLFFVKELRFEWVDGWRRSAEGRRFENLVKRYRAYRARLARMLNPTGARIRVEGEDGPLKTALSPIDL